MTQIIDLGKLRFSFAGDWLETTSYEANDVVKYGGNVYVYTYALKQAGVLPTDVTHWALMVKGFNFTGVFAPETPYRVGEAIAYGGKVYVAVLDGTGNVPPNAMYWSQFVDGIQYEGEYAAEKAYQRNDVVLYGGSAFIAKIDSTGNLPSNLTYWKSFVSGISPQGVYNAETSYVKNDIVAYGANRYLALNETVGNLPTDITHWEVFTQSTAAQGVYGNSKAYFLNDTVTYGGNLYQALQDTVGNSPTNTVFWTMLVAGLRVTGPWTTATTYYQNDIISYGGNTYVALAYHASTVFNNDLSADKWQKFNSGVRWTGAWAQDTVYLKDDIVKDAVGSAYIAAVVHTAGISFNADVVSGKWEVLAVGGSDVLPVITPVSNGGSLTVLDNGAVMDWIGATASANVIYVASHGVDEVGYGANLAAPYASVKYACQNAAPGSTIFVRSGDYLEQLPIIVPANVAVVGDNQRTSIIHAAPGMSDDGITPNAESTMWMLSNGSILNKMTFKGMTGWVPGTTADDVTTSTIKGVFVRFNPDSPITSKSPYVLECSAIASGGIGALVEGNAHGSGNRSMIFHGYTIISDNGIGYWVKDNGKAEIVSCFTYYCYFGYTASGGSYIRALNGNNSYGTWGATSRGFDTSETAITGTVFGEQLNAAYSSGTFAVGETISNGLGATATVVNVQYSADKIYISDRVGTFASGQPITSTSGGQATVIAGAAENQQGFVLILDNLSKMPLPGDSISLVGDTYSYVIQSTNGDYTGATSKILVVLSQEKPEGSANNTAITIRSKYSQIRLTGHDFLSIGTGGVATTNHPNAPTQPSAQGNEVDEAYPGRVYYVSTDQDGNFRVGEYFRIDQATGKATLNANAFDLSGLSSLRLGSIGAQLGESINEFSADATLAGNSNVAVPTEYAVKTYVDASLNKAKVYADALTVSTKAYADSTIENVVSTLNAVLGDAYSFTINPDTAFTDKQFRASFTSGGATLTWSLTATKPSNMTINQSGVLSTSNAVITAGTYNFTIRVVSGTVTVDKNITVISDPTYPVFSSAVFPAVIEPNVGYTISAATASVISGTIVYTVTSGTLPSGMSLSSSTGILSGTGGANSGTPIPYSFTVTATSGIFVVSKVFSGSFLFVSIKGQALFGTNVGVGTFTWIAPPAITSVCVVAVGSGGWGGYQWSSGGTGGGGLGWKNNIPVTPGQSYTVSVGTYGTQPSNSNQGSYGTNSFFISTSTVAGYSSGQGGPNSQSTDSGYGGGWFGDGGGYGGKGGGGSWTEGGGGAGGYAGNGGAANSGGSGGGGGGSSSYYSSTWGTGGGGGVDLNGQGANGSSRGYNPWSPGYSGSGGQGGSGGADGTWGELPWANGSCNGGNYGGGGGGSGSSTSTNSPNTYQQRGGQGGVRIIWGPGRAFPSTQTTDV